MARDWWVDFHDDGYRFLYGQTLTPERTEVEIAGLVKLLKLQEGAKILDLCCGDGRHSVPLQRRGMRVTGIDISMVMLRRAQERAEKVLPEGHAMPSWILADARQTPLKPKSFDVAVCLFNSLGFGNDDDTRALLQQMYKALKPGGQLLTESVHRDHHVRVQPPEGEWQLDDVGGVAVDTQTHFDPLEGVQHTTFKWQRETVGYEKKLRYRAYTATELAAMLRAAGFSDLQIYGGYDASPFSVDGSQLVIHARAR